MLAPIGSTKRVTRRSMPRLSSRHLNVTGRVAVLYANHILRNTAYDIIGRQYGEYEYYSNTLVTRYGEYEYIIFMSSLFSPLFHTSNPCRELWRTLEEARACSAEDFFSLPPDREAEAQVERGARATRVDSRWKAQVDWQSPRDLPPTNKFQVNSCRITVEALFLLGRLFIIDMITYYETDCLL